MWFYLNFLRLTEQGNYPILFDEELKVQRSEVTRVRLYSCSRSPTSSSLYASAPSFIVWRKTCPDDVSMPRVCLFSQFIEEIVRLRTVAYSEPRESYSVIQALITLPFGRWIGAAKNLPKSISSMALTSGGSFFLPKWGAVGVQGMRKPHTPVPWQWPQEQNLHKKKAAWKEHGGTGATQTWLQIPALRVSSCDLPAPPAQSPHMTKGGDKAVSHHPCWLLVCSIPWVLSSHLHNVSWISASWHHLGLSHHHLSAGGLPSTSARFP